MENILDKNELQVQGNYYDGNCLDIAAKHAEKVAVKFLDSIRDYERESGKSICYDDRSSSELYKYFITKIYNQ